MKTFMFTQYIIIILSLTLLVITILVIKPTKWFRKEYNQIIMFLCTILATFIGVFSAIYLNDLVIENNEKETTIELLNASKHELDSFSDDIEILLNIISRSKNPVKFSLSNIQIDYISIFPSIFRNDIILKNISEITLIALNEESRNLSFLNNILSTPNLYMTFTDSSLIEFIYEFKESSIMSKQLIENEILYLKKTITKEKHIKTIDDIYNNYISIRYIP